MITETTAVTFRQNLGEMLNRVQYRNDSILISKDGKPVAALVDARLFERIRRMQERFDALARRLAEDYAAVPEEEGLAEIEAAVAAERAARKTAKSHPGPPPLAPPPATVHVVLDTNVLVSGLAYPASVPGRIVSAWRQGGLTVILSRHILDELARVLPRLNHRLGWADRDFADFFDTLALLTDLVEPVDPGSDALRDGDDLPVLGTLLASGADYLITGDKDLLALADRYPILTPSDFWARHGN